MKIRIVILRFSRKNRTRETIFFRRASNPRSWSRSIATDHQQFIPASLHFFFSSLPFDRRSRILEEKIVSTAFVHQYFLIFLVARSGFCAISPVLDGRIGIIAVSVCRSIAGGWLKIRGRGLSPWKFYSSRGEWKSQRFRDETMNERERE